MMSAVPYGNPTCYCPLDRQQTVVKILFSDFIYMFTTFFFQGYYRQAIALQCMGRYAEALAAYASALAHDGKSQQLLQALVEAAFKSPLQGNLSFDGVN